MRHPKVRALRALLLQIHHKAQTHLSHVCYRNGTPTYLLKSRECIAKRTQDGQVGGLSSGSAANRFDRPENSCLPEFLTRFGLFFMVFG